MKAKKKLTRFKGGTGMPTCATFHSKCHATGDQRLWVYDLEQGGSWSHALEQGLKILLGCAFYHFWENVPPPVWLNFKN